MSKITLKAKKFANAGYGAQIPKTYNDEIGDWTMLKAAVRR